jgi:DNA-binding response OmpR family regulator
LAPKILFINKFNRKNSILSTLQNRGYSILRAANGLKLISHLEVENPDLIIMDTKSTWPNSFSLCSALRKGKYKTIPIFFLSSKSSKEESKKSYHCGCTQYFDLPEQLDNLYCKVKEFAGNPEFPLK